MKLFTNLFKTKDKVLVISGGGVRWFYALGILKAIEEFGMRNHIKEVYGVSAGAIIGAYWCAGYSADEIFEKFINLKLFWLDKINLLPKKSFLKNDFLEKMFGDDLPSSFEELEIPLNIGATDIKKAKFMLFNKEELIKPLLASMSIPCVFPPILYKNHLLVDGGLTNNFPVDIAKKNHPRKKIIGINLNKFVENQDIKTMIDGISITYEILMRSASIPKMDLVDYLFHTDLHIKVLDTKKEKMKAIYLQGYQDALRMFS